MSCLQDATSYRVGGFERLARLESSTRQLRRDPGGVLGEGTARFCPGWFAGVRF